MKRDGRTDGRSKRRANGAPSMNRNGHIASAVAELLAERDHLAARLEKVNTAIAAVRDAFHLPAERAPRRAPKASSGSQNGDHGGPHGENGALTIDALRVALKDGPTSPGELAATLGMNRAKLRYQLKPFEERGLVISTGTTASRRIALPQPFGKAAKEAP